MNEDALPDLELDQLLQNQNNELVHLLREELDLSAGAAQAVAHGANSTAIDELRLLLDLESGLTNILAAHARRTAFDLEGVEPAAETDGGLDTEVERCDSREDASRIEAEGTPAERRTPLRRALAGSGLAPCRREQPSLLLIQNRHAVEHEKAQQTRPPRHRATSCARLVRCHGCGKTSSTKVLLLAMLFVGLVLLGLSDRVGSTAGPWAQQVGVTSVVGLSDPPTPTAPPLPGSAAEGSPLSPVQDSPPTPGNATATRWQLDEPFVAGSAELRSEAVSRLHEVRSELVARNVRVAVTIWTAESGTPAVRVLDLSNERVTVMRGILVGDWQAPPERVDVQGYVLAGYAEATRPEAPPDHVISPEPNAWRSGTVSTDGTKYGRSNELELRIIGV